MTPAQSTPPQPAARGLRVLFFGTATTAAGYPRPRVLLRGLRDNGVEVIECRAPLWASSGERVHAAQSLFSLRSLAHVLRAEASLLRRFFEVGRYDAVLVGPEGYLDIILVRLLSLMRRRPVVFDPFISLYDTMVEDRQLVAPRSFKAGGLRFLDRLACRLADAVILDTEAMVRHYAEDFQLPRHKLFRVLVGEEDDLFSPPAGEPPPEPPAPPLRVLWFGTHIPLHGVPVIIAAAAALQRDGVQFTLIGNGQGFPTAAAAAAGLENVTFIPGFVPPAQLREQLEGSHVALGIFGTTKKASRVIPCKVFDILSAGRALVTADTPAIRELVLPDQHAVLVPAGDAAALARALLALRDDPARRTALARAGITLYRQRATPKVLGAELLRILQRLIKARPQSEGDFGTSTNPP